MTEAQRDKAIYREAKQFLPSISIPGVTLKLVGKYLRPEFLQPRPRSIPGIYVQLLKSAQNANMKAGGIGRAIGGIETLTPILSNFDPHKILSTYGRNWNKLLDEVEKRIKPKGKIRRTSRSIWPQYCRSILSGASFLVQFKSATDFFQWVDFFDSDSRARPSLPLLLSREIDGFGFALACDFLKEMGYVGFPKPDVHLRDIFRGVGLCDKPQDDYTLFKSIVRLAANAKVTPYNADKVFWLIGSGYFYADPHIGKKGRIGSHKKEFIQKIESMERLSNHSLRLTRTSRTA